MNASNEKIAKTNYPEITDRNVVKAYIYFHPNRTSSVSNGRQINIPKLVAHEAFHSLGIGNVEDNTIVSIMEINDATITHLQQYDYLFLKSKYPKIGRAHV